MANDLIKFIQEMQQKQETEEEPRRPDPDIERVLLQDAYDNFTMPYKFHPGDLITGRQGFPYYANSTMLVLELISPPIVSLDENPEMPYTRLNLDLLCAKVMYDKSGGGWVIIVVRVDSRFVELHK